MTLGLIIAYVFSSKRNVNWQKKKTTNFIVSIYSRQGMPKKLKRLYGLSIILFNSADLLNNDVKFK